MVIWLRRIRTSYHFEYEGKRYCISESLSINKAAAAGNWIRNEADASNADASSHWCGCDTGLGLGGIGSAARGSECKRYEKDPQKGLSVSRRQHPPAAAAAASPSLMGSKNNFGGITEFAAKNNLLEQCRRRSFSLRFSPPRAASTCRPYSAFPFVFSPESSYVVACNAEPTIDLIMAKVTVFVWYREYQNQCGPLVLTWLARI